MSEAAPRGWPALGDSPPVPPGPGAPSYVQLARWVYRPLGLLRDAHARYGETFSLRFPHHPPIVLTSEPQAIRDLFRGDPEDFRSGAANRLFKPMLGPSSLIILDGGSHRHMRRLLMPPFHGERMRAYAGAVRSAARSAMASWPRGRPFPVHPELRRITLEVILRAVLGLPVGERLELFRARIGRLLDLGARRETIFFIGPDGDPLFARFQRALGPLSPLGVYDRLRASVDGLLYEEIASRRAAPAGHEDILSLLVEATDEDGRHLTDDELRDQLVTLLVAGYETTATAMAWALACILGRAAVHERIAAELRDDPGAEGSPAESYLVATVKETLRLHPVLPFVVRLLERPARLGPLDLPRGVIAAPNIWRAHRREDTWSDPEAFRPERFAEKKPAPHEFLPFGGAPRTCLGMALALFESRIVLAEVLGGTRLRLAPGYRPTTVRRNITLAPSRGVPVVVDA